jgi:hypothetical protein
MIDINKDFVKKLPVHVSIMVFDNRGKLIVYLSNIMNAHHQVGNIENLVKKLYQNYLNDTFTQVCTICKILFVHPSMEDKDYFVFGKSRESSQDLIYQALGYKILTPLFRSEDGDKITKIQEEYE